MPANRMALIAPALLAVAAACSSSTQGPAGAPDAQSSDDGTFTSTGGGDDGSTPASETGSTTPTTCNTAGAANACQLCELTSCCAATSTCLNDPDCESYYRCMRLTAAGVDAGTCTPDGGAVTAAYTAFDSCLRANCAVDCATCHGTALDCTAYVTQTICNDVGCAWSASRGNCSGVLPPICSLLTTSSKCTEAGCTWSY